MRVAGHKKSEKIQVPKTSPVTLRLIGSMSPWVLPERTLSTAGASNALKMWGGHCLSKHRLIQGMILVHGWALSLGAWAPRVGLSL